MNTYLVSYIRPDMPSQHMTWAYENGIPFATSDKTEAERMAKLLQKNSAVYSAWVIIQQQEMREYYNANCTTRSRAHVFQNAAKGKQ